MVIYICCAGGVTSGLFCEKIKKSYDKSGKKAYVDDIKSVCRLVNEKKLEDYQLILGYGPAGAINEGYLNSNNIANTIEGILISPQVRYYLELIEKLIKPYNIKCNVIDMITFGTMDGEKGLLEIKKLMEEK